MPNVVCGVAALAVASIFYTWRAYHGYVMEKQRRLRERIAYMLWMAANVATE